MPEQEQPMGKIIRLDAYRKIKYHRERLKLIESLLARKPHLPPPDQPPKK